MIIGVIGGSGLYQLKEGGGGETVTVETPWGPPSAPLYRETFSSGNTLLFLPRHGPGHTILPSELNSRANIFALKKLGADVVISVSAVGSLREEIGPGDFVLPEQYIDVTRGSRPNTFFGNGVVGHALFADPTCATLRGHLRGLITAVGKKVHVGGTYVCIEGPQFSTRAESHLYRSWDLGPRRACVIGMTALPEAKLAREAGLCYQTVAMATDYDCWNERAGDVSIEAILKVLHDNVDASRRLVSSAVSGAVPPCQSGCKALMRNAVITPKHLWPSDRREALEILLS